MRGLGKTKLAFYVGCTGNIVNLAVSCMLIYGWGLPCLGARGAAWGTGAYQLTGGLLAVCLLMKHPVLRLGWRDIFILRLTAMKRILRISLPAAMEQLAIQGGRLIYSFILVSVGAVQFAAHQIAVQVESLSFLPCFGFSVAAMTLVGQNLGKTKPELAAQYAWVTTKIAFWSMSAMEIFFLLFARQLTSFFTSEADVIYWGILCVMLAALEQPFIAVSSVLAGALRGAGDTKWPMYIAVVGVWFIRVPLVYLLIVLWKQNIIAAWVITAADFLVRSIILWRRFSTNEWQLIK